MSSSVSVFLPQQPNGTANFRTVAFFPRGTISVGKGQRTRYIDTYSKTNPSNTAINKFSVFAFRVVFVFEDLSVYLVLLYQAPTGFEPLLRESSTQGTVAPVDFERGITALFTSSTRTHAVEDLYCQVGRRGCKRPKVRYEEGPL